MDQSSIEKLMIDLFKIEAVKFGSFTLKSGIISPFYFDLRNIVSFPKLMTEISQLAWAMLGKNATERFDVVSGVPYTALPIATLVSVDYNIPMIFKRKEEKNYGTGKMVEGLYKPGARCIIIEDVITTGSSIIETALCFRKHGMEVTDAIVIMDREQGAVFNLAYHGIRIQSLIRISDMLEVLAREKLITTEQKEISENFISRNQLYGPMRDKFQEIMSKVSCPASKSLLSIIQEKKTNLCLSADLDNWIDVLDAAELLGPKICLLKTHLDSMNFGNDGMEIRGFWTQLKAIAHRHKFLIMEDRKFADIGSTVSKQITTQVFEYDKWADFVTVHAISGPGIIQAFNDKNMAIVLIAEMSSEKNLMSLLPDYKRLVYSMAKDANAGIVAGFVSQSRLDDPQDTDYFLQFTPGVSLNPGASGDGLGQQYCSVEEAINKRGADIVIVGRGILKESKDRWLQTAEQFRGRAFSAFTGNM